jgi:hypothetical protein
MVERIGTKARRSRMSEPGTMTFEITYADGVAVLRCTKDFTYEDAVRALGEVVAAPWRGEMRSLLVLDDGSAFSPTRDGVKVVGGLMDAILEGEGVRIAVVVAKVVHYGIGRMIEARTDRGSRRMRVFLSEEAARNWLGIE